MVGRIVGFGLATLSFAGVVWADVGHGGHAPTISAPPWVWVLGLGLLTLIVLALIRQARQGRLLSERFRGFSRNARLLLIRSPFSGLSVSLLRFLFNLYLLAVGFDLLFVAKFTAINWTFHGLSVIPSGILSDLFGRRRVFLIAYGANLLATTAIIFVTDPAWLLVLAALTGLFEGGHAIVGPPFMIEQSRADERVHLFSLNGGIQVGAASLGNLAAGVLPFVFASGFGIGPESAWARRAACATSAVKMCMPSEKLGAQSSAPPDAFTSPSTSMRAASHPVVPQTTRKSSSGGFSSALATCAR